MSVTGNPYDKKMGVIKVRLTSLPQLHPFSLANNAAQNYYCLALDTKGFQVEIDLQAMPPGVTLAQLQPNQVWWVEKRTTLYRLYLYGGIFDSTKNQVVSTAPLPSSAATGGVPAGTLLDFAGPIAPSGYLLCDGSSYSTTTYSGLFSAISYTWGGTGSSFNVPDLRGRTTIGAGSGTGLTFRALATYSGEETHVLVSGETPLVAHSHGFSVPAQTGLTTSTGTSNTVSLNTAGGSTGSGSTSSGTGNIASGNTGSNTTGIAVNSSVGTLTAAGQTATVTDPGHKHQPSNNTLIGNVVAATALNNGVTAGGGYKYVGKYSESAVLVEYTSSIGTGITVGNAQSSVTGSINSSVTDNGHTHSLSGVSVGIPSLTVNALSIASQAVTGSVSIPGLAFTVPAQNSLTTSNNTATTASGHNNMQPYAVVTKIIKY